MKNQKLTTKIFGAVLLLTAIQSAPALAGDAMPGAAQSTYANPAGQPFALQNRPGCRMMMGFMAGFNQMMAMSQQPQQQVGWAPAWPWMWQPVQPMQAMPRVVMEPPRADDDRG